MFGLVVIIPVVLSKTYFYPAPHPDGFSRGYEHVAIIEWLLACCWEDVLESLLYDSVGLYCIAQVSSSAACDSDMAPSRFSLLLLLLAAGAIVVSADFVEDGR